MRRATCGAAGNGGSLYRTVCGQPLTCAQEAAQHRDRHGRRRAIPARRERTGGGGGGWAAGGDSQVASAGRAAPAVIWGSDAESQRGARQAAGPRSSRTACGSRRPWPAAPPTMARPSTDQAAVAEAPPHCAMASKVIELSVCSTAGHCKLLPRPSLRPGDGRQAEKGKTGKGNESPTPPIGDSGRARFLGPPVGPSSPAPLLAAAERSGSSGWWWLRCLGCRPPPPASRRRPGPCMLTAACSTQATGLNTASPVRSGLLHASVLRRGAGGSMDQAASSLRCIHQPTRCGTRAACSLSCSAEQRRHTLDEHSW